MPRRLPRLTCLLLPLALAASAALADARLGGLFGDHMVLQREIPLPVFGSANAGEKVTVSLAGQTKTATADKNGAWRVTLDALQAGGPHTLAIRSGATIEIKDVLIGEVWLCSGQSNMAMTVSRAKDFPKESAAATLPKIRHFRVGRSRGRGRGKAPAGPPPGGYQGAWQVCDPKTVGGFSATAYFFGRALYKELDVPVGLINSSVGGTPIEQWTGPDNAGGLYTSMIAPLVPYGLRGAIWYQGERNSKDKDPSKYAQKLTGLIRGWRGVWKQGEFPFYYVQLPDFQAPQTQPVETSGWVINREAMLKSLACPNTGMAVTIGTGEAKNIHPKDKQEVGRRLALWALAKTYGRKTVYSGPIYKSMRQAEGKIVLEFDHVGGGLVARGQALKGFAVAGADKRFVWAEARIQGDTVEVSSPRVKAPAAVRYAWAANPQFSLFNKEGLPASPFRTDDWPLLGK